MKKLLLFILVLIGLSIEGWLSSARGADISELYVKSTAVVQRLEPEVDIASATTTTLASVKSGNLRITGTTPITSFGSASAGLYKRGRFAGAVQLTHSSNLLLPGAVNFTSAANDRWEAFCLSSGTWIVKLDKADGTAVAGGAGSGDVVGAASSTNNNLVAFSGTGGKTIKDTKIATDGNGNMRTPGSIEAGADSGTAGAVALGDGGGKTFRIAPPTLSTSYNLIPDTAPSTGFWLETLSATTNGTITKVTATGSGSVVRGTSPTIATPTITGAIAFPDDVRQTFNPGTTTPGFSVGSIAGDPSTPSNGDMWYDSTANELTARINGANVALGAGGGSTIGYTIKFGGVDSSANPANGGFTYYSGGTVFGAPSTTYNNQKVYVPKAGTIKVIFVRVRVDGTLGTTENVVHKISINGAAGTGTGVTLTYSAVNNIGASASESIAVAAGDYIALTFTTPTWATPPTTVYWESWVYIE